MFHFRSEEIFIPRSLADLTISNGWLFTTIRSSIGSDFENVIRSSLHLVSFRWNFVARVWSTKSSTDSWILLFPSLGTASAIVVSSTNFQRSNLSAFMSSIITRNSHGPNFVPCGAPAVTDPHYEKQSWLSLTRCFRFFRKSMTQLTIPGGRSKFSNFLARIAWSKF